LAGNVDNKVAFINRSIVEPNRGVLPSGAHQLCWLTQIKKGRNKRSRMSGRQALYVDWRCEQPEAVKALPTRLSRSFQGLISLTPASMARVDNIDELQPDEWDKTL